MKKIIVKLQTGSVAAGHYACFVTVSLYNPGPALVGTQDSLVRAAADRALISYIPRTCWPPSQDTLILLLFATLISRATSWVAPLFSPFVWWSSRWLWSWTWVVSMDSETDQVKTFYIIESQYSVYHLICGSCLYNEYLCYIYYKPKKSGISPFHLRHLRVMKLKNYKSQQSWTCFFIE